MTRKIMLEIEVPEDFIDASSGLVLDDETLIKWICHESTNFWQYHVLGDDGVIREIGGSDGGQN